MRALLVLAGLAACVATAVLILARCRAPRDRDADDPIEDEWWWSIR